VRRTLSKRDERGISSVIVVVSLLGVFSSALLSLDFGSMWSTRRRVVAGTDSTALDQAIFAGKTGAADCNRIGSAGFNGAYQDWTNTLMVNTSGFVVGSQNCSFTTVNAGGIIGYVGVEARKEADTRFGGLFGFGSTQPYSYSAARVYYPDAVQGLRPIGICLQNTHVQEWIAYLNNGTTMPSSGPDHPTYQGAGAVHRITYTKDANDACGDAPGNWGFQDFDGDDGGNSDEEFKDWMLDGYDGLVNAPSDCDNDGSGTSDQPGGVGDDCPGNPGSGAANSGQSCSDDSLGSVLACVQSTPGSPPTIKEFPIVIFDQATCTSSGGGAGGNNCTFNVVRYVGVRLWGFKLTGSQDQRYFDLEFVPYIASGPCCAPSPNQTDIKAVQLCAVDHDTSGLTEAQRCAQ
jgi:hypothetical protein